MEREPQPREEGDLHFCMVALSELLAEDHNLFSRRDLEELMDVYLDRMNDEL